MVSPCGCRIDRSLPSANRTDDGAQEAVPMADRERLTSPRLCAVRAGAVDDVGAHLRVACCQEPGVQPVSGQESDRDATQQLAALSDLRVVSADRCSGGASELRDTVRSATRIRVERWCRRISRSRLIVRADHRSGRAVVPGAHSRKLQLSMPRLSRTRMRNQVRRKRRLAAVRRSRRERRAGRKKGPAWRA